MSRMPALSLAAVPGRRLATLELAGEIERRGFTGIYCPSTVANVTLCAALAQCTNEIHFGTSIAPIYARTVLDYAQTISFIHEISGGRFRFGIEVWSDQAHRLDRRPPVRYLHDRRKVEPVLRRPPLPMALDQGCGIDEDAINIEYHRVTL